MKKKAIILSTIIIIAVITTIFYILNPLSYRKTIALIKSEIVLTENNEYIDSVSIYSKPNDLEYLNKDRTKNIYPVINDDLTISKYKDGTKLNIDKLYQYMLSSSAGDTIKLEDCRDGKILPSKLNKQLEDKVSTYNNFKVEYSNSNTLTINDIKEFVTVKNNEIVISTKSDNFKEALKEVVKEKTSSYNTYYNEWTFESPANGTVKVATKESFYGDAVYGSKVDIDAETNEVIKLIESLSSVTNRTPKFKIENGLTIPDTYVEVSITDQHLWYVVDGQVKMDSGVVTGWKGHSDSPIGVFQVFQKSHNVRFDGGLKSKNWMRFTNYGHGLHDATWRNDSQFEDHTQYIKKGSHGCINLPLEFSNELYEAVEDGTVVIVHE